MTRVDADCMIMAQFLPPILGAFSGTTIESPGLRDALSGSPENHPPLLFFDAITDPSARITKTAFYRPAVSLPLTGSDTTWRFGPAGNYRGWI